MAKMKSYTIVLEEVSLQELPKAINAALKLKEITKIPVTFWVKGECVDEKGKAVNLEDYRNYRIDDKSTIEGIREPKNFSETKNFYLITSLKVNRTVKLRPFRDRFDVVCIKFG